MKADRIHFPRSSDEGRMTSFEWMPIRYRNVIAVLVLRSGATGMASWSGLGRCQQNRGVTTAARQ
jgi:hypothetical protein